MTLLAFSSPQSKQFFAITLQPFTARIRSRRSPSLGETENPTWPSGRCTFFASGQATNGVNYPLFADWNIFDSKRDEIHSSLAVVSARDGFGGHGFAHSDPDALD